MLSEAAVDSLRPARELMPDETDRVSDKPSSDAQSALESAARVLRATAHPIQGVSAREREVLAGRQVRDLFAWARESGRLIEPRTYLPQAARGGEEHRVWPSEQEGRVRKCTYPGRCGFTVLANPLSGGLPGLAAALPL